MKLNKIRRIAAQIFKVGERRIWFDSNNVEKLNECMTKEDVRAAIKEGFIKKKKIQGHSRGSARILKAKKKKGRKRGRGKKKGTAKARAGKKKSWIRNVRAQRKKLRELKKKKVKMKVRYSKAYRMIKGGYFKGKKYVEGYVKGAK